MLLKDFDFDLPKAAIALRPAAPRDSSRLLLVEPGAEEALAEAFVRDVPALLRTGDVLVLNNTKVIPATLSGYRPARSKDAADVKISLTLIRPLPSGAWKVLARPARRLHRGDPIFFEGAHGRSAVIVTAAGNGGEIEVEGCDSITLESIMEQHGVMPLPPYISRLREADERDRIDYQTAYAAAKGAIAAPTAGLHFTPQLLETVQSKGIRIVFVTLHVGAGTFLPVKDEGIEDHQIHEEWCEIPEEAAQTINTCKAKGGRLVAVGTTSLRLLETAALADGTIMPFRGVTNVFIKPGHRFRSADLLMTNFHLPKSTLFMLVCAFSGTALMKKAYAYAIAAGFRFYSYGDACLLYRASQMEGT